MSNSPLGGDQRLPLYQQLRDDLARRIAAGEWLPDEAIPTEAEIKTAYNIAIGTVRKAVDALVAEGLLERSQGKGTFVRRPRFDASLFRFFRFQNAAGEKIRPKSRILARTVEYPAQVIATSLGLGARVKAIRLLRLRVVENEPFLIEEIWLPRARFSALLDLALEDFGDLLYPLYESRCKQVVASAQETLTVELASPPFTDYLKVPPSTPLVVIERIAYGYDKQPLEWRASRGAAERFKYHVDIR
ncbi:GntR family transcriptional regulator [Uliginosibacterium gangwonense]|uniref:GntR family transcriptional regulator n=1 Tax=Uliginosibacterium gangwonense TaxID=392736 RepID=UPI000475A4E8|nr:GntR family transcriptional regulator [Uliginosibacterium gangwonense]